MRVNHISATNFMSFAALDYDFPETGLFFVGGQVAGSSSSSSNGAGKSAIFEALSWGLYGKTVRETKKLVRRGSDGAAVIVMFLDDRGHECELTRTRDIKNMPLLTLMVDGKDMTQGSSQATQDLLDKYIGMSWLLFSTAVMFGEKAQRFIEASETDKKKVFDEILMLQQYLEAQQAVKADLKDSVEALAVLENESRAITEGAEALKSTLQTNILPQFQRLAYERKQVQAQARVDEENLAKLVEREKALQERKAQIDIRQEELSIQATSLFSLVRDLESKRNAAMGAIEREIATKKTELRIADDVTSSGIFAKRDAENLSAGSLCPTCGQDITAKCQEDLLVHWSKMIRESRERSEGFRVEISKLSNSLLEVRSKFDDDSKEVLRLQAQTNTDARVAKGEAADVSTELMSVVTALVKGRASTEVAMDALDERERYLRETEVALKKQIQEYTELLACNSEDKAAKSEHLFYLRFWEEGFGNRGLKSFLIDETLPHLNARANYYLSTLLDDKAEVIFDTESLTAKGESRDKFSLRIRMGKDEIEYAAFSAGEKRRIDVAILLALQSLIFARAAASVNFSVLDEVFDSLDRAGIERVVNLLIEESESKVIYVVSHLSEFRDFFPNEILVRKVDGISTLEAGP